MELNNIYTGIGARNTPESIQKLMYQTAQWLSDLGYVLRSGGAQGADQAFEKGCDSVGGKKEIYLPWHNFEGSDSRLVVADKKAFEIAERYHPYWHNLKNGAKKLQARNSHQVLGKDLETPTDIVLCYTDAGLGRGGTGQALRIAKDYNIPIFDFGSYDDMESLREGFRTFCISNQIIKS